MKNLEVITKDILSFGEKETDEKCETAYYVTILINGHEFNSRFTLVKDEIINTLKLSELDFKVLDSKA